MFKKIEIKNFQSHKDTVIELNNGINVFVGSSHSGKTAVLRAIKWVVFNRPLGDSVVSAFAKGPTAVTIYTDDGHVVQKVKSKKETYYVVDGEKLTSVRSSVPEAVKNVLKLDDLNFQFQHDGYFLLTDPPSTKTKKLNDLIGLSVSDELIKVAKDMSSERKREIKTLQTTITELKGELDSLDDLIDKLEPLISDYENSKQKLDKLIRKIENVGQIVYLVEQLNKLSHVDLLAPKVTKYEKLLDKYSKIEAKISALKQYVFISDKLSRLNVKALSTKLNRYEVLLNKLNIIQNMLISIKKIRRLNKVSVLSNKIALYQNTAARLQEIDDKIDSISTLTDNLLRVKKKVRKLKSEIKELKETFHKNVGDVCPLCGQPIKSEVLQ